MKTHALAWNGLKKHPMRICGLMAEQIAIKLAALSPLLLCAAFHPSPDNASGLWKAASLTTCILLIVLLVFPARFRAGIVLRRCVERTDNADLRPAGYRTLVSAGMLRFAFGLIWGLPFLICCIGVYLYVFVYDASRAGELIERIGRLAVMLIPSADAAKAGVFMAAVIYAVSFLLFLYGCQRGVAYDYILSRGAAPVGAWKTARRLHALRKGRFFINALLSFILIIASLAGFSAVIAIRSGGISQGFMMLYLAVSSGIVLDPGALAAALAVFVLLYLPFIPYRKARNAAVVQDFYEEK